MSETIYESDSGRYLSSTELWQRLESGEWEIHRWEAASGKEWLRTDDDEIIELTPVDESALPEQVTVEQVDHGVVVHDERSST